MFQRFILDQLRESIADTPVVFLNGPRQAGKSTLVQMLASEDPNARYYTLDDLTLLSAARSDPEAFLAEADGLVIIDEVQRAPDLFLAIKRIVDADRRPGRFLLTGSANVLLLPKLADSLAGRMEIFTLHPLATSELRGERGLFIETLFNPNATLDMLADTAKVYGGSQLDHHILMGGFPEVQTRSSQRRRDAWFNSYLNTILQRDVRELAAVEGLTNLPNLLRVLATRSGSLTNFDALSRSCGLPTTTLRRYFTLLQTFFFIDLLPAWSTNLGKRLIKAPKLFLSDTGLLCHLIGLDQAGLHRSPEQFGALLETHIVNEVRKMATWSDVMTTPYHYRTTSGLEVDLVLESQDRRIVGIEVKSASRIRSNNLNGLRHLAEAAGDRFVAGVILYRGDSAAQVGDRLYALPLH